MSIKSFLTLSITFLLISFLSCSNEKENQPAESVQTYVLPNEGIEIENAWARPGSQDGVSAIYFTVLNGTSAADTLVSISSPEAAMVQVHESYESEEGMMGMRRAEHVIVAARDALLLEPGGLHVMLIRLNRALTEGDEVRCTVVFANAGEMTITAPVKSMQ